MNKRVGWFTVYIIVVKVTDLIMMPNFFPAALLFDIGFFQYGETGEGLG